MLRSLDLFRDKFLEEGIEIVAPNVVQTLTEKELIALVPTVDGWIIGDDPATERVFQAGRQGKLRAAVKWGVGVDNVDFEACKKLGIPISNTPGMFGNEVADIAIGYMLGLARHLFTIDKEVKANNWIKPVGMSLTDKTIALIGLGDIGLATAKRLKGFNVKVNAYDPFTQLSTDQAGVDKILTFPDKINDADFVILTCALTASSEYMINASTLALMKPGVRIVNVSRGKLIHEDSLVEALEDGQVSAAALDVFEIEPLPVSSKLRKFNQCLFGTHNGSNTREAVIRTSLRAIELLFTSFNSIDEE